MLRNSKVAWYLTSVLLILNASANAEEAPWESGRTSPSWSDVAPARTLHLNADADLSADENGRKLAEAVAGLRPGDMLLIGAGRYSLSRKFSVNLAGTSESPIWIVGADSDDMPIITRPDATQNVMNVGERSTTEYVCFRHLELTGGSTLIRFYDCHHVWLDQCHLHHAGAEGITTNSSDTSHMFITGNHFHHFINARATGEAMYLGANQGRFVMSYSVIADNHVHDCGGTQGDGIEIKQGSHHNWIVRNHVHDTKYPCIIVYGTGGNGLNVIEQNTCYRSNDNVMQVQGEAIVRNNLLMAGDGAGFASTDHQGETTRLQFIHNTVITKRRGANLSSWNDREGMVMANNVIYTDQGDAVRFPGGAEGVTIAGNVVVGRTGGLTDGLIQGNDLADFVDVTWTATRRSAAFTPDSPLTGSGVPHYSLEADLNGDSRNSSLPTPGAFTAK